MDEKPARPPIALLTDFGLDDPFVGVMKGVILGINPHARIVDLSHGVRAQDVAHGAFLLAACAAYFPKGTVFCAVVDPGVGSNRKPVLVQTRDFILVGPDNGLLWQAANDCGIKQVFHLNRQTYFLPDVSNTFHGRDIFSPVAAHASLGGDLSRFGDPVSQLAVLAQPQPRKTDQGLVLTVLHVDTFGNIVLNITAEAFRCHASNGFCLTRDGRQISRACPTYAAAPENTPVLVPASHGYMEIAVKNGSAAQRLKAGRSDTFLLIPG